MFVQQSACHAVGSASVARHAFARIRPRPLGLVKRTRKRYVTLSTTLTPVDDELAQLSDGLPRCWIAKTPRESPPKKNAWLRSEVLARSATPAMRAPAGTNIRPETS